MDPAVILSEAAKMGPLAFLLVAAVVYLVRRDNLMQSADRVRTDQQFDHHRNECMRREEDLSARLRQLEDRQHEEHTALLRDSARALADNAAAFRAIAETPSGLHRIVTGRPHP